MDQGVEPITDADELAAVRNTARSITRRAIAIAVAATALSLLVP